MKNKKILIAVITIVLCLGFGYFFIKQNNTKKEITAKTNQINQLTQDFEKKENREEKLKILQNFISTKDELLGNQNISTKVLPTYNDQLTKMKTYFTNEYDQTLKDNTIENVDESTKEDLTKAKDNLNKLSETLKFDSILTEDEIKDSYSSKIESLVKSYEDKIKSIEEEEAKKAEEEKQRQEAEKAEQERQATEAATITSNSSASNSGSGYSSSSNSNSNNSSSAASSSNNSANSSNNNYSGNSNSGSSASSSNSAPSGTSSELNEFGVPKYRNGAYFVRYTWSYDRNTGEKIPGTEEYIYSDGSSYDINGNYLGNIYDF